MPKQTSLFIKWSWRLIYLAPVLFVLHILFLIAAFFIEGIKGVKRKNDYLLSRIKTNARRDAQKKVKF